MLKCDIRKFFASIDYGVLLGLLRERIADAGLMRLLGEIIGSFSSGVPGVGLPLGNLTSQLFANVYMDAFDQIVKHGLKVKQYIRYADDFVLLSHDRALLVSLLPRLRQILDGRLILTAHPDKIFLKTFASGVDFLGWVHFHDHRVLRAASERRMLRGSATNPTPESLQSRLGLLGHGNTRRLRAGLLDSRLRGNDMRT